MTHDDAVANVRMSEDCDKAMLRYVCDMAEAAKGMEAIVKDIVLAHSSPESYMDNDCGGSWPCEWCVDARAALAAMPKETE